VREEVASLGWTGSEGSLAFGSGGQCLFAQWHIAVEISFCCRLRSENFGSCALKRKNQAEHVDIVRQIEFYYRKGRRKLQVEWGRCVPEKKGKKLHFRSFLYHP
jgi:hypothetical protein